MKIKSYQDLSVWSKAVDLVTQIYAVTKPFPSEERFGLALQIRRSAISIPSNIAEGSGRDTTKDLLRFLSIARGSLAELHTQLIIAKNIGYINQLSLDELKININEIGKMVSGLQNSLEEKLPH